MSVMDEYLRIKAKLQADVETVLLTHVAPAVKEEMQAQVYDKVYAAYKPTKYVRRWDDGGMGDVRNYEASVDSGTMTLTVQNLTTGNPDYKDSEGWDPGAISDLVQEGTGYHWTRSRIYRLMPYPRPYTKETEQEVIRKGTVERELRIGLSAMGHEIKEG